MDEQEWAKEPWELEEDDCIVSSEDAAYGKRLPIYYDNSGGTFSCGWRVEKASLPRIVACMNACQNIPTHILEHQGVIAKPPYDPLYPEVKQCPK